MKGFRSNHDEEEAAFEAHKQKIKQMTDIAKLNSMSKPMKMVYFWEVQERKCYYCKQNLWPDMIPCNLDHKIAVSSGGKDDISNLCLTCIECNTIKGSLGEVEFSEAMYLVMAGKIKKSEIKEYTLYKMLKPKFENLEL